MSGREPTFSLLPVFVCLPAPGLLAERDRMAVELDTIRALADRVAASHGLEVVDIEYLGNPKQRLLRVYIEKDAAGRAKLTEAAESEDFKLPAHVSREQLSGITVEDCQVFSDDFGTVLDVEDLVPTAEYSLEVSSPGLDRKLRGREDFERFRGLLVKLRTVEPVQGNSHWQGRIAGVGPEEVELELGPAGKKKKNHAGPVGAERVKIALTNILKANLVPEL